MRIGTLVDFCEDLIRSGEKDFENYIAVCRADMHGCKRPISAEEDARFEQNADRLRQAVKILQTVRAPICPAGKICPKTNVSDSSIGNTASAGYARRFFPANKDTPAKNSVSAAKPAV